MATAVGTYATTALFKQVYGITTDATDDTVIGLICDRVNAYIESSAACGRVIAPVASATFSRDGNGTNRLFVPEGIRACSKLELATQTRGTYSEVASTDYFLRPARPDPGGPYTEIWLSDVGANLFWTGFNTVKITATTGFAAIPDDVTDVALRIALRSWNDRQTGVQNVAGVDEQGRTVGAVYATRADRDLLRRYAVPDPFA